MLVDTGPLVALLHKDDQNHRRCLEVFSKVRRPLLTTWPPVTEAMYLLSGLARGQDALLDMIERRAIDLLPVGGEDMPRVRHLLRQYRDLPMDFADATLVRVAEREGIGQVFTLDRRGFGVYRMARGRAFSILP